MGWTGEYIYNGPLSYAAEKARVEAYHTGEYTEDSGAKVSHRVLHISNARPAWYVAVEVIADAAHDPYPYAAETLEDGRIRYVFAQVMLTRNGASEWMHKAICEGAGPAECKAPAALIAKLSPLQDGARTSITTYGDGSQMEWGTRIGNAENWRARCATYADHARRVRALKPGDRIKTPAPLAFGSAEADSFTVMDPTQYGYRKTMRIFMAPGVGLCRIRPDSLIGFERIA